MNELLRVLSQHRGPDAGVRVTLPVVSARARHIPGARQHEWPRTRAAQAQTVPPARRKPGHRGAEEVVP